MVNCAGGMRTQVKRQTKKAKRGYEQENKKRAQKFLLYRYRDKHVCVCEYVDAKRMIERAGVLL